MSRFLSPTLSAVTPYTPGEQPQDQQYIKLNTNESPYLPSPAVVAAVSEAEVESSAFTPTPPVPTCCGQRRPILACSRIRSCPATAATRTCSLRCGPSATNSTRWPMPISPMAATACGAGCCTSPATSSR